MGIKRAIRNVLIFSIIFLTIAFLNFKFIFFSIPDQPDMVNYQSDLFTASSVFAGFSFSVLGLILGIFSEKIIEKLKGTTLIQRKCYCIVQSILYFCVSCLVSLMFILGLNKFLAVLPTNMSPEKALLLVNTIFFMWTIGFIFLGLIYFIFAVKSLLLIIEKIYGFNQKAYEQKVENYNKSKKSVKEKRERISDTDE